MFQRHQLPSLLSQEQVAQRFGVCIKTVSRWIRSGELRCHRIGRVIRISEDDAKAFLATRRS